MTERLELTFLGYHWEWSGDLFYMTHPEGMKATVSVDSLGKLGVDVRRIPEGGSFHTERVEWWHELNGPKGAEFELRERGFDSKTTARFAHRVRERDL